MNYGDLIKGDRGCQPIACESSHKFAARWLVGRKMMPRSYAKLGEFSVPDVKTSDRRAGGRGPRRYLTPYPGAAR